MWPALDSDGLFCLLEDAVRLLILAIHLPLRWFRSACFRVYLGFVVIVLRFWCFDPFCYQSLLIERMQLDLFYKSRSVFIDGDCGLLIWRLLFYVELP